MAERTIDFRSWNRNFPRKPIFSSPRSQAPLGGSNYSGDPDDDPPGSPEDGPSESRAELDRHIMLSAMAQVKFLDDQLVTRTEEIQTWRNTVACARAKIEQLETELAKARESGPS